MKKNKVRLNKNVQNHTIEAYSANHQYEISDEFTLPLLDPEGILAENYTLHLKEEFKKNSGH